MHFDWAFFWKSLFTPSEPFVNGLILTIVISAVAMVLATLVGLGRGTDAAIPVRLACAGAPASTSG